MAKSRQRSRVRSEGLTVSQRSRNEFAGEFQALTGLIWDNLAYRMQLQFEEANPGVEFDIAMTSWSAMARFLGNRVSATTIQNFFGAGIHGYQTRNPHTHTFNAIIGGAADAGLSRLVQNTFAAMDAE